MGKFAEGRGGKATRVSRLLFGSTPNRHREKEPPIVVSFTGGTGAQILSLSILADLLSREEPCGVDLSYFDQTPQRAAPGRGVSTWGWGLDYLGFSKENVASMSTLMPSRGRVLRDSPEKLRLALAALTRPTISSMFPEQSIKKTFERLRISTRLNDFRYAAFHLRRGDYLNVASHVVPDGNYIDAANRISTIVPHAVIMSDSPVPSTLIEKFQKLFAKVTVVDNPSASPGDLHHLLRNASIHVGSNGQFSLSAGLLSRGLYFLPKSFMPNLAEAENHISGLSHFSAAN